MGVNLRRSVKWSGLNPDEAALATKMLFSAEWQEVVMRRLKSRHLPWRSYTKRGELGFYGIALWPMQRRYIATKVRDELRDLGKVAQGRGKKRRHMRRVLGQRARSLRASIKKVKAA